MNIYLMSDIHGEFELFLNMLEKIAFNKNDILYILGDVIDRGTDSFKLIDYIRDNQNIILLAGNHEELMVKALLKKDMVAAGDWFNCGGDITKQQFQKFSDEKKLDYLNYLESLHRYKILDLNEKKFLLTHAGIIPEDNDDIERIVSSQNENWLYLGEEFLSSEIITPFWVVFGHTPTNKIIDYDFSLNESEYNICEKFEILKWKNRIALDCGCGFYGCKLGCLRLNDFKEFYLNYK